jgi:hypothetical protein
MKPVAGLVVDDGRLSKLAVYVIVEALPISETAYSQSIPARRFARHLPCW